MQPRFSIISAVDGLLARSPLQALYRWRSRADVAIIAYHGVEDAERFAAHLDHLAACTHPISVDDLLAARHGRALPERASLVTFDDGDRSVLDVARPLLRRRGIPAVVFVVAGWLDRSIAPWWIEVEERVAAGASTPALAGRGAREIVEALKRLPNERRLAILDKLRGCGAPSRTPHPQLRAEELRLLVADGIAVGNHTWSHPCLPRCSAADVDEELCRAHERLTNGLGHHPRVFAYPNGDADERAVRRLVELGYEMAFVYDHRLTPLPIGDPYRVSRVRVHSHTSLDRLRTTLSGLHPALYHAAGARRAATESAASQS